MRRVKDVFDVLNALAPVERKMDFDNVGLLVGDFERETDRVLVALDITDEVIGEAVDVGADLIVSHHPLIFHAVKSVRSGDLVGRKILALAKHGISAISMHTNLDLAEGGVNDALADALGIEDRAPLMADGLGRIGFVREQPLSDFLPFVKSALHANGLRFVDGGRSVHRVAVCGGAGGSELMEAVRAGCDTYVTADVKYNPFLDARELGINLIDAGHFPTENVVTPKLRELIRDALPELEVRISRRHCQPERFYGG